jgi:hypothetical protein
MGTEAGGGPDQGRWGACAGAVAIAATFAGLAIWSWGRWTDPQIDYGNELYIAWQLSEGQALYRDIAQRGGPLSHHLNALFLSAFGVSLRTLVWCNLVILAAICGLGFAILKRAAGAGGATLGVLVLLGVFAFSQYVPAANYNYVTPYHHFQTHGLALGLGLVWALLRTLERGSIAASAAAGLCLGAVALTKLELSVPAATAAAAGWALIASAPHERRGNLAPLALAFGAGALLPAVCFLGWLSAQMPLAEAGRGLLGNLAHLGPGLASDRFYVAGMGLDDAPGHLLRALGAFAATLAVVVALLAADRGLAGIGAPRWLAWAVGLVLCAQLAANVRPTVWFAAARGLPLVSLAAIAWFARSCARDRRDAEALARAAPWLLWSVYALTLLGKMLLNARIHHYGFVLAMPATLLLVTLLVQTVPETARRRWGGGSFARAGALALVAAAVFGFLRVSHARYQVKELQVGRGADAIRVELPSAGRRGATIGRTLERLEELLPPEANLLVYPEGAGLNFWLRRRNPSRYTLFLPTELDAFGHDEVLDDVTRAEPDFIVLLHRGHREFGTGPFGADPRNGRAILSWVRGHYERIETIGAPPFQGRGFGAEIWRRRPAQGSQPAAEEPR